jgi:hypothetical protein
VFAGTGAGENARKLLRGFGEEAGLRFQNENEAGWRPFFCLMITAECGWPHFEA